MIKVQCEICKQTLEAPNELAGKKAQCPGCRAPITVPTQKQPRSTAATSSAAGSPTIAATNVNANAWTGPLPGVNPNATSPAVFGVGPTGPTEQQPVQQIQNSPPLAYAHDCRLGFAAVMSFFLPGMGQIFKRQITRAFMIQGAIALLMILSVVLNVVYKMLELTGNQVAPLALIAACVLGLIAVAIWTWQIYDASR